MGHWAGKKNACDIQGIDIFHEMLLGANGIFNSNGTWMDGRPWQWFGECGKRALPGLPPAVLQRWRE
jgi:hypothetical protein